MADINLQMFERCPDDAVILDIGANHGKYTIQAAKFPNRKVYAFEPAPENLKILRDKIGKSDRKNIEVHGIALSDRVGVEKLMIHPSNPGGHSIHKALDGNKWRHSLANSIDVGALTLDKWCEENDIKKIDGIKIDVEAHEVEVITGAKETLKKYHPLIALETHGTVDCEALGALLSECGYVVPSDLRIDRGYLLEPK